VLKPKTQTGKKHRSLNKTANQNMKTPVISPKAIFMILSLVFFSLMISGCKPKENPANLVGKWKAEFTTKIPTNTLMEINQGEANVTEITTETNGSANLVITAVQNVQSPQTETITGTWKQADDFLIIERSNGGFVAFRISSEVTTNQFTVFTRTGRMIQYNRIP
jgi:hypothetical protein